MKCYWCGKENKNLEIDQEGNVLKHFPCNDCNQPERSKREDSLIREMMESSKVDISKLENKQPYPLVWDQDMNFVGHKVIEEMRCSEHDGNAVREVQ